jgi:hypothetical protein
MSREAEHHALPTLRQAGAATITGQTMRATGQSQDFWSDTYRGHTIAVLNHGGRWLVYLDHVLQHRMLFDTAEAAVNWLQRKIDRPRLRAQLN